MSPADRAFYLRAQRRVAGLEPDVARAVLRAFEIIRENLTDAELVRIIDSGNLDRLFAEALNLSVMDRAFIPFRQRIRDTTHTGFKYTLADLPKGGKVRGTIGLAFDTLAPQVIQGIRQLETKAITALQDSIRETVRAFIENGLRDGVNPRTIGKQIRGIVGMSPTQERNAARYAAKLAEESRPAAQVERMVAAYRKRAAALNAETNARTATLDAMKLGQALAWKEAVDKGVVSGDRLVKVWKGVLDNRERDSHVAMENQTVPYDAPYSNGQMYCGQGEWNCRCVSLYRVA